MKAFTALFMLTVGVQTLASGPARIFDSTNIVNGEGTIRSRNFLHEYGKTANSLWRFTSHDWQNYALILKIQKLKLFYWNRVKEICLGSYNLTINGVQEKCTEFVLEYTKKYVFYNSPTCMNVSLISSSKKKTMTSFPLEVKYESDGRKIEGVHDSGELWGFQMAYQFIKCPDSPYVTTTPDITTSESTTTAEVETTEAERTEEYPTKQELIITKVSSIESFTTTQILQTTKIKNETPKERFDVRLLTILLEAGAALVGVTIIITLAFGCKRQHEKRNPRIRRPSEAPLFGLDSPTSTDQGFAYSINPARTRSQCSDNRISNPYASIHEATWRQSLDYVTMAEVADENTDGNAIYASVTFNPNINDQENAEYAPMNGDHRRLNRYEDWPRHASVTAPIYARPKSLMKDNSTYVTVKDSQNNNEYLVPTCVKAKYTRNPATAV